MQLKKWNEHLVHKGIDDNCNSFMAELQTSETQTRPKRLPWLNEKI